MDEHEALLKLSALCSRSEVSSGDAMEKMWRWKVPEEVRRRVLDRLISERFIDDERFSRFFARDKIRFDHWGRRKIEQALMRKGVSADIVERVLSEFCDDDYTEQLAKLLASKRRSVKAANAYELSAKLTRFALGRGFTYDIIKRCLVSMDDCEELDGDMPFGDDDM